MASSTKSRRRKRGGDKPVTKLPQLERSQLRNRFAPITALDEEQLELIHDASLDILEDLGIEVLGELAT